MKNHPYVRCPVCSGSMTPVEVHCDACDVSVKGHFALNEFAALNEDDLHLLRIFVLCEGGIREMESALGVSYPSIKGRLGKLRDKLKANVPQPPTPATPGDVAATVPGPAESSTAKVLKDLEAGRTSFEQAMERLRQIQAR